MQTIDNISRHFKDTFYGGNWTSINFKDCISDIDYEEAGIKSEGLNSIAELTYHIDYYLQSILNVLEGDPLDTKDVYSFQLDKLLNEGEWKSLIAETLSNADKIYLHLEQMDESQLWQDFIDKKYGSYFYNICGVIEHTHYHLGQIQLIKKMLKKHATYELLVH